MKRICVCVRLWRCFRMLCRLYVDGCLEFEGLGVFK
ncbi:hypothetical protein LINGRAHAP2_LOCUS23655 [Linum grandiflorum]